MLRLNWFLPKLRKPKKGKEPRRVNFIVAFFRKLLPGTMVSDLEGGKPGLIRRMLQWLGPTWLSAPGRRIIQGICFLLFLWLFLYVCWPYEAAPSSQIDIQTVDGTANWPSHYQEDFAHKEFVEAEVFLIIDPLVAISTAIAAKAWVWSLYWAAGMIIVCILFPRGFCGYICPLGTLIDLFDWCIGKRINVFKLEKAEGWWVNLKYYILVVCLVAAACGVLLTGFVAAIPVLTRGLLYCLDPFQTGWLLDWHQVPAFHWGHIVSLILFIAVLALGLLRPRFWCRYVCPSGATFSVFNFFRVAERKVSETCINCDLCRQICPFDAIQTDYLTKTADCTLCQTCGGVCPTDSITFVGKKAVINEKKPEEEALEHEIPVSRRGFLYSAAAGAAMTIGIQKGYGANLEDIHYTDLPVRPPGSVPEKEFLQLCIRCDECFKACPNHVLQPIGFEQGLEGLWTPYIAADWAGCDPSCNNCGQVCPTGAIRAIPLEEKRYARVGLAEVNKNTCLPFAGKEDCDLCIQECDTAGYHAIDIEMHGTEMDDDGMPIDGTGFAVPVVNEDNCVGCGLCQTRCNIINVNDLGKLEESAIIIYAGGEREDRIFEGSYFELRQQEYNDKQAEYKKQMEALKNQGVDDFY